MEKELKRYKKSLISGKLGFWSWDALTNKTEWSDEKFILFGLEPQEFEVTFERAFESVHPEDRQHILDVLEEKMPSHSEFDYEYRGLHKSGKLINVWVRVEVQRNEKGEPIGVTGISQDITERKKLEEQIKDINSSLENQVVLRTKQFENKVKENELLLKEMHHRVKNNLQVMSSILRLQKDYLINARVKSVLDDSISRIKTMALIHESLYSQNNLSKINVKTYFEKLIGYYLTDMPEVKIRFNLDSVYLTIESMMPLGMIVNELVANSFKHAFKEEKNPIIELTISKQGKGIDVVYNDNGSGYSNAAKESFGMDLIATFLEDLRSSLELLKLDKGFGVHFHINDVFEPLIVN